MLLITIGVAIGLLVTHSAPPARGITVHRLPTTDVDGAQERGPDEGAELPRLDVTDEIRIAALSTCSFSRNIETAFDTMLRFDENRNDWRPGGTVRLGGLEIEPDLQVTPAEDVVPGGRIIESSVRPPAVTYWNGLRLSRLISSHGDFPEIDDYDSRALAFLEPLEVVSARLRELGHRVPVEPDYLDLTQPEDACGGSMQLTSMPGGSALVCTWGC